MLLVDDLLTSPVKGLFWVFREIHKAATEAQAARRDDIMAALSALYLSLEAGEIDDAVFDTREQALLDELDALDAAADADADDDAEDDNSDEAGSSRELLDLIPGLRATTDAPAVPMPPVAGPDGGSAPPVREAVREPEEAGS